MCRLVADQDAQLEDEEEPTLTPVDAGHVLVKPLTLAIDIGGTRLKASVLDATGAMVAPRSSPE